MTRLKDALDKAAHERLDDASRPHYSVPSQIVPDVWGFDDSKAAPTTVPVPQAAAIAVAAAPVATPAAAVATSVMPSPSARIEPALRHAVPASLPAPVDADHDAAVAADVTAIKRAHADQWVSFQFGRQALGKLIVGPEVDGGLVEQYRRLGAALHHHQLQTGCKTLMVTSAVPSEGKTLTATNLALTLSHSYQRRVLLIDADLRKPSVHDIFRLPHTVGLSESLRRAAGEKIRSHALTPTFSILTAGRPDSDPMAGLVSDTMNQILIEAAAQFDWVIVDTPPVALLPDANLLAAMIDTALLVVGANSTPYPLVRRALEAVGEQRILGVVLNRLREPELAVGYSYYGYGKYGYGYGYGYGQGLRKRGRLSFLKKLWRRSNSGAAPEPGAKLENVQP